MPTVVDRMLGVPDAASVAAMRFLRERTGIRAGGSTGTNLYGAPVAQQVERETGVPVLDSVAVTIWNCLALTGSRLLDQQWGRLLS